MTNWDEEKEPKLLRWLLEDDTDGRSDDAHCPTLAAGSVRKQHS